MKADGVLGLAFFFTAVLLTACASSLAQGQTENPAPSIEILKLKWHREVRLPRNFDPSVIPTDGAFNGPSLRSSAGLEPKNSGSRGQNAGTGTSMLGFPPTPGRLSVFYIYSMKIRNKGPKTIEGLAWDYLFIDARSNAEVGRHQFLSYERIPVNYSATLRAQVRRSPIRIVHASQAEKKHSLLERAEIQCVLYADDTIWRNATSQEGVCDFLRSEKIAIKQSRH